VPTGYVFGIRQTEELFKKGTGFKGYLLGIRQIEELFKKTVPTEPALFFVYNGVPSYIYQYFVRAAHILVTHRYPKYPSCVHDLISKSPLYLHTRILLFLLEHCIMSAAHILEFIRTLCRTQRVAHIQMRKWHTHTHTHTHTNSARNTCSALLNSCSG